MYVHFKNCEFFVIRYKALIGGLTVLIIYFAADSCELTGGNELCKAKNETCIQVTGFDFECQKVQNPCEANPCCESGPTPLCCQNGVCNNVNFVFNATTNNADECQCLCTDNFSGLFKI